MNKSWIIGWKSSPPDHIFDTYLKVCQFERSWTKSILSNAHMDEKKKWIVSITFRHKHDSGAEILHILDKILESWDLETIASLIALLFTLFWTLTYLYLVYVQQFGIFKKLDMAENLHNGKWFINQKPLDILTWNLSI